MKLDVNTHSPSTKKHSTVYPQQLRERKSFVGTSKSILNLSSSSKSNQNSHSNTTKNTVSHKTNSPPTSKHSPISRYTPSSKLPNFMKSKNFNPTNHPRSSNNSQNFNRGKSLLVDSLFELQRGNIRSKNIGILNNKNARYSLKSDK